jgi:polar amino acid transport system substrate-binding protein
VGPSLGREIARRLGLSVAYVIFDSAGPMADAVRRDAWDVAFLAADPARAADIAFSAPYVLIEGTYLVRRDSPIVGVADADREGVRVAVGDKTAYDLFLSRNLRHATLVKAPTSKDAINLFLAQGLDAVAGVRNPLAALATRDPRLRVLADSFMAIGQAAGVPRARAQAAAYVAKFIDEAKRSGFVASALAESGVSDVGVAP